MFNQKRIILSVPISGDIRTTLSPISFESKLVSEKIIVPSGLKTDLGSIPRTLQPIFPKDGKAMFAYILHDFLYKTGIYDRITSDRILIEAMRKLGVGFIKSSLIYSGLRIGGWYSWRQHRKRGEDEE